MKHRKGIDLVRSDVGYTVGEGSARTTPPSTEAGYRVEVWSEEPEAGGELLETDFPRNGLLRELRSAPGFYPRTTGEGRHSSQRTSSHVV